MYFEYKDMKIYYETIGTGLPLFLIHGFAIDHRSMKISYEAMANELEGLTRIYVDLPGMGRSTANQFLKGSDEMLEVLLALINHVVGVRPFAISGMSYGGYLARGVQHRLQEQVVGLQMIVPVVFPAFRQRDLPKPVVLERDPFYETLPEAEQKRYDQMLVRQTRALYDIEQTVFNDTMTEYMDLLKALQSQDYAFHFDVDHPSTPYQAPTSLILGKQDAVVGYKDALTLIPNYDRLTLGLFDTAGHMAQYEQEDLFQSHTKAWLKKLITDEIR